MYRELILTLSDDDIILTPNRRLALTLTREQHALQGKKVSECLSIYSLADWLNSIWINEQPSHETLLTPFQEELLWQEIIQNHTKDSLLLPTYHIAQQAMQAHQLLAHFCITLTPDDCLDQIDAQHFLKWQSSFKQLLSDRSLMSQSDLPASLLSSVDTITLPKRFTLVGFVDPSPIVKTLFESLSEKTDVLWYTSETPEAACQTAQFANPHAEIEAMAEWAKQQWKNHPRPEKARIACVVPSISEYKTLLTRLFSDSLRPASGDPFTDLLPFNLSQGEAMLEYPMIRAAFHALQAQGSYRPIATLSSLLCSPYITSLNTEDADCAAQCDADLRNSGYTHITNDQILAGLQQQLPEQTDSPLLKRWEHFLALPVHEGKRYPSDWIPSISQALDAIGWPGQQTLNSEEFQLLERWQKALLDIAALDDLLGPITRERCLDILRQYLSQSVFQAQAHHAPIHVLGLLEASGLHFDAIWVMGLDSNTWPAGAQPNPYIPMHLQREHLLPQSTAERERVFSLAHQKQLLQSAPIAVLSCAEHHDDIPREASQLLAPFPKASKAWLDSLNPQSNSIAHPNNITQQDLSSAPAIPESDHALPGGSALVNEQAQCPFRAFVRFRLRAESIHTPQFGVSPALHGVMVHRALEMIWHQLRKQEALLQLSKSERKQLVEKTSSDVIAQHPQVPKRLRGSQHTLLTQTLSNWLSIEAARTPFRIKETEQRDRLKVGKHVIRVRLDRVDELPDGSILLIDYKTNAAPPLMHCLPPYSTENQLPLYTCFSRHQQKTVGLAFAVTHKDQAGWSGLIDDNHADALPLTKASSLKTQGEPLSWSSLQAGWKQRTHQLIDDFTQGVADIDPAQPNLTCRYCDYHGICRIGLSK